MEHGMNLKSYTADLCILGGDRAALPLIQDAIANHQSVILVNQTEPDHYRIRYGAIPKNAFLSACHKKLEFQDAINHVHDIVAKCASQTSLPAGIQFIQGKASFIDPKTIQTEDTIIKAKRFILATGTENHIPNIAGLDSVFFLSNETIFELDTLPKHLIILGGSPFACEMADAFRRFGSRVTLLTQQDLLLNIDNRLTTELKNQFTKRGIQILENVSLDLVEGFEDYIRVSYEKEGHEKTIEGSELLVSFERQPALQDLNLDRAKIKLTKSGQIKINSKHQTTNRRVRAIGDVVGPYEWAENIYLIYTHPQIAQIGLTSKQVEKLDIEYKLFTNHFEDKDTAWLQILATKRGEILGMGIIHPFASALLAPWTLMMQKQLKLSANDIRKYIDFFSKNP